MGNRVKCEYCGKEFSSRGIYNHEKFCEMRPENKEKNFKNIIPNKSIGLKVFGQYYKLEKNEEIEVENEVANILRELKLCTIEEGE